METSFLLLNHASILINYNGEYLLTDPWFMAAAFGSWLPTPPMVIHPVYLASIDNLSVLVSHGHDDHLDDKFMSLLNPNISIVTSDYNSPGVENRLSRIGFSKIFAAGEKGIELGPFQIKSYRNKEVSLDDAIYTIKTADALIIHANDCWFPMTDHMIAEIKKDINIVGSKNVVLLSQTNSASGYPLAYSNLTRENKNKLLHKKIVKMIKSGLENCRKMGITKFAGYAGYSLPFVKGKEEYITNSIFPTPKFLKEVAVAEQEVGVEILDLAPGQEYNFKNELVLSARVPVYNQEAIKKKSIRFYEIYNVINECDSYNVQNVNDTDSFTSSVKDFLNHFNSFVTSKVLKDNFESSVIGKSLRIEVSDLKLNFTLCFGEGLVDRDVFNKKIIVESAVLNKVVVGNAWFENLYTGYNAELERYPEDVYNRDIVVYISMFSYFYKNRILKDLNINPIYQYKVSNDK